MPVYRWTSGGRLFEDEAHFRIVHVRLCPTQRPHKALVYAEALRRTENRSERAHDKLVVVASEASHAKRGHVGLNDRDPELAAEIISLSARP